MLDSILDPVLNPLLDSMHPFWFTLVISFIISLVTTIIYKFLTDQKVMKQLKEEMKELQKEMKELQNHPEKMMDVQKKAMETNMKYMTKSLKPTLVTFIPLIILFGWMSSSLGYLPVMPEQNFMTTATFSDYEGNITLEIPEGIEMIGTEDTQKVINNQASWTLNGKAEGEYILKYNFEGESYTRSVIISRQLEYSEPIKVIKDSRLKSIRVNNEKLKILNLGFMKLGWLGVYIISSLIFSMGLRKVLKIA